MSDDPRPNNLSDEDLDDPNVDDARPKPSAKLTPRNRRQRTVLLAGAAISLVVVAYMYSNDAWQPPTETEVVAIAPTVYFEQQLNEVKDTQPKMFHISDYVVDDSMLMQIAELKSLETLIVDQGIITDESMDVIASLPKLQHLRLRRSPITDQGLRKLAQCESLWYLNIPHSKCTAEGVAALAKLPRLRQLRLGSTKMGNEAAREIATIRTLRGIHLIGVEITDEGLSTLADMPHLESLYLDDSAVTDAGWQWLYENSPELHVHVNQKHHDRDPKAHKHHD